MFRGQFYKRIWVRKENCPLNMRYWPSLATRAGASRPGIPERPPSGPRARVCVPVPVGWVLEPLPSGIGGDEHGSLSITLNRTPCLRQ